ncbi:MAG: hypothetical protein H7A09_04520 [Oceanospirillaceae bacterium]|nr:hypothetical protein [Oceanospirillaceae bacterium]MCP5334824.1 hypothetical protein [Oceanospirillaceae bacterium]MCP5349495.1 hypothetical protein [Oceanospirillaceae bacterium]
MKLRTSLLVAAMALGGCTLAPQKLQLETTVSAPAASVIRTPLIVTVSDKRSVPVIGYRNAQNQGELTLEPELNQVIGESLTKALSAAGVPMATSADGANTLQVEVNRLTYSTPDEVWVTHIKIDAEFTVVVQRGNETFKKRFKANQATDVALAPNDRFNAAAVSGVVSELLNKIANDPETINFLK